MGACCFDKKERKLGKLNGWRKVGIISPESHFDFFFLKLFLTVAPFFSPQVCAESDSRWHPFRLEFIRCLRFTSPTVTLQPRRPFFGPSHFKCPRYCNRFYSRVRSTCLPQFAASELGVQVESSDSPPEGRTQPDECCLCATICSLNPRRKTFKEAL